MVLKYRTADLRQLLAALWRIPEFHEAATNVQDVLGGMIKLQLRRDARLLWRPDAYPNSLALICMALRAADPTGQHAFVGPLDDGRVVAIHPWPATWFLGLVGTLALMLCRRAGYDRPSSRDRIIAALALMWPAESVDDVLDIVPICGSDALDGETRTLLLADEANRPDKELPYLERYKRALYPQPARPTVQWTPAGAPRIEDLTSTERAAIKAHVTKANQIKQRYGRSLSWETIARKHIGVSRRTLQAWRDLDRTGRLD